MITTDWHSQDSGGNNSSQDPKMKLTAALVVCLLQSIHWLSDAKRSTWGPYTGVLILLHTNFPTDLPLPQVAAQSSLGGPSRPTN
jgi:hypothetical protein